jgi:hypothetical protein
MPSRSVGAEFAGGCAEAKTERNQKRNIKRDAESERYLPIRVDISLLGPAAYDSCCEIAITSDIAPARGSHKKIDHVIKWITYERAFTLAGR